MSKTPAGKKDLSSKLAGAVRAARTEQATDEVKETQPPITRPTARQSGRTQPSLDEQRGNPQSEGRIWPD
ncbi:MAG: hypothetical protein ABIR48_02145 [Gammaproteobacteria bacterium]